MASPPDPDSLHDEHGLVEVLEAAMIKFQRASIVSVKGIIRADEATSCLALLGMRWLHTSEVTEESRRRNLSRRYSKDPHCFEPTHTSASLGTFAPSQHTPKSMRQTESRSTLLPPYSSALSQDDLANTHDPKLGILQTPTYQTAISFTITPET
jgi:hypothetical protein